MVTLLIAALAVFWAWEFFLALSPWQVPPVLHPILVAGLGYLATVLDPQYLLPAAIAGLVGILHTAVSRYIGQVDTIQLPRRQRRRSEVGGRIPDIP